MTTWTETIVDGRGHEDGYYHASASAVCTEQTRGPWTVALRRWPVPSAFEPIAPVHERRVPTRAHATALMQTWVRDRAVLHEEVAGV